MHMNTDKGRIMLLKPGDPMCNVCTTNYLAATESIFPAALWMTFEPGRQPHLGHRVVVVATPWTLEASTGKEADV